MPRWLRPQGWPIRGGCLPLLLTPDDVDKGVDETDYQAWLAEQGETA